MIFQANCMSSIFLTNNYWDLNLYRMLSMFWDVMFWPNVLIGHSNQRLLGASSWMTELV